VRAEGKTTGALGEDKTCVVEMHNCRSRTKTVETEVGRMAAGKKMWMPNPMLKK